MAEQKKICLKCGKEQTIKNFYLTNNELFSDGKFPICKNCIEEYIEKYEFNGLINVLQMMDRPWLKDLYNGNYKDYIRMINSLHQYKSLTFSDSVFDSEVEYIDDNGDYKDEVIERWYGFSGNDIPELEKIYQDLIAVYEHDTPIQKQLYRNIAVTQLEANKAIIKGDIQKYDKLMATLSRLMTDANIKPVQESGIKDNSLSTWGEWVKKIEETEPIPEPKDEFKDPDGILKYIDRFFVKHFAKVFGVLKDDENDRIETLTQDDNKNE